MNVSRVSLTFGLALLLSLSLGGCEIVASFDRAKIPGPAVDAATSDDDDSGTAIDASTDAGDAAAAHDAAVDGSTTDAAVSHDAGGDDAGSDDAG